MQSGPVQRDFAAYSVTAKAEAGPKGARTCSHAGPGGKRSVGAGPSPDEMPSPRHNAKLSTSIDESVQIRAEENRHAAISYDCGSEIGVAISQTTVQLYAPGARAARKQLLGKLSETAVSDFFRILFRVPLA